MREASTVVLLREPLAPAADDGPFELLLVQRHRASAFMGGAHVFPGGKLDAADAAPEVLDRVGEAAVARCVADLEPTPGGELTPSTAVGLYVAACRETFEEAGVLLARHRSGRPLSPDRERRQALEVARQQLHAGERSLGSILDEADLQLDLDALVYLDHWVTPSFEERRFDARFFVTRLPRDQDAAHDGSELTEHRWCTAAAARRAYEQGEIYLAPPTLTVVDDLVGCASIDEALSFAAHRSVAAILPKVVSDGDEVAILMPWDSGYATAEGEALPGLEGADHPRAGRITRVVSDAGRWRSHRR